MGYYIFAYGVNTPKIEAVFGSKNEALLAEVQKNKNFQNYAEGDDDNETTKALTDIIMGRPFDEEKALMEDYNIEVEIDTELFGSSHSFPLPLVKDFPIISLIDQDGLKHLASLFERVHKTKEEIEAMIDGDDEEKGFAYEHIMGLKENIAFCLSNQLDMIVFCH